MPEITPEDITALADDRLDPARRAAVEAAVAASPELAARLEDQRRARDVLRAIDEPAPQHLREAIRAELGKRRSRAWPARPRLALAGGLASAVAAALVVVLILGGGPGAPSVAEAAALSDRTATDPAPPPQPGQPRLLAKEAEGLPYPNWLAKFGWRATGSRSGKLGNRHATTVYYEKGGKRIGYTIVSGDALPAPSGARAAVVEGTTLQSFTTDGRNAVRWLREGRTCVLAGRGVAPAVLLKLAGWKGQGAVPF